MGSFAVKTSVSPTDKARRQFLCGFELEPNERPFSLLDKYPPLTRIQQTLVGQKLMIRQMAAFSQRPGVVHVLCGRDSYEAMSYSLELLSLRWPDAFNCFCEIEPDELGLSVQYDNGAQPKPDEKVLIVLGGTFI